jgi:hypothetical protein
LWPDVNVKEGFEKVTVETKQGALFEGNKIFENGEVVLIKTATSNETLRIFTKDIERKMSHGSIMPSGLTNSLSEPEVRDMIRYLSELGSK